MKKFLLGFIVFAFALLLNSTVWAEGKVKVYMLTKEGCSGCIAAYEYFDNLEEKYPDLFELVPFEVFDLNWKWNSDELETLFYKVYEYFGEDTNSASTPTIVVGDYFSLGLPGDESIVYNEIVKASESGKDVFSEIAKEANLNLEKIRFDRNQKESNYDVIIVIGIFAVLIGGFAGLVILSKK